MSTPNTVGSVFIAYVVIAILLAAALGASASLKLRKAPRATEGIHGVVGVPLALAIAALVTRVLSA